MCWDGVWHCTRQPGVCTIGARAGCRVSFAATRHSLSFPRRIRCLLRTHRGSLQPWETNSACGGLHVTRCSSHVGSIPLVDEGAWWAGRAQVCAFLSAGHDTQQYPASSGGMFTSTRPLLPGNCGVPMPGLLHYRVFAGIPWEIGLSRGAARRNARIVI